MARQTIVDTDVFYSNGNKMVLKTDVIIQLRNGNERRVLFQSIRWRSLVVDEAHRLKIIKQSYLNKFAAEHIGTLAYLPTGTPIQNSTDELWSLLSLLDVEEFGRKAIWRKRFSKRDEARCSRREIVA